MCVVPIVVVDTEVVIVGVEAHSAVVSLSSPPCWCCATLFFIGDDVDDDDADEYVDEKLGTSPLCAKVH